MELDARELGDTLSEAEPTPEDETLELAVDVDVDEAVDDKVACGCLDAVVAIEPERAPDEDMESLEGGLGELLSAGLTLA